MEEEEEEAEKVEEVVDSVEGVEERGEEEEMAVTEEEQIGEEVSFILLIIFESSSNQFRRFSWRFQRRRKRGKGRIQRRSKRGKRRIRRRFVASLGFVSKHPQFVYGFLLLVKYVPNNDFSYCGCSIDVSR